MNGGRSQSLHSTEAARAVRLAESKAAGREGRQEGGSARTGERQSVSEASAVSARTKREAETGPRDWGWVEATIWTERMLAALGNGVKGSKWFSLINAGLTLSSLNKGCSQ